MWKGTLEIGGVQIPVKLYAAVEDRGVHFRLLHAKDRKPVRQQMVDPRTEQEVPADAIQRGAELEPGVFVVLRPDEIDRAAAKPSRGIEVTRFVPPEAIDVAWYERPYFLGPDGSSREYAALVKAIEESALHGIARWTMRGRRYVGALHARDGHLVLIAMRGAEEVVRASDLPNAAGKAVSAAEREMAEQLVAALDGPFDPDALHDEYRERLQAYLAAKAKGRRVQSARETLPRATSDLAATLERSLAALKKRRAA